MISRWINLTFVKNMIELGCVSNKEEAIKIIKKIEELLKELDKL